MRARAALCGLWFSATAFTALAQGCGGSAFETGDASAGDDGATMSDTGPIGPAEGGPPVDGGIKPDVVPRTGWCATRPEMFCEDFDQYTSAAQVLVSPLWSNYAQVGGQFQLDLKNSTSPPNALQALGTNAQVLLVRTFPPLGKDLKQVRLEFDMRINATPGVDFLSAAGFAAIAFGSSLGAGYAAMAIGQGPSLAAVWSVASDAGPSAGDAGPYKIQGASGNFPSTGVWGRYAIEIDYGSGGPAGCLQVYNGSAPLLQPCLSLPPSFADPSAISIAIGDQSGGLGSSKVIDLDFDNVTFGVQM